MSGDFLKYLGYAGGAILLYLLLRNPSGTAQVFQSLSGANVAAIGALQGRTVNAGSVSVSG